MTKVYHLIILLSFDCIYILFETLIVIMCNYFPKLLKTHFFILHIFCSHFGSFVQLIQFHLFVQCSYFISAIAFVNRLICFKQNLAQVITLVADIYIYIYIYIYMYIYKFNIKSHTPDYPILGAEISRVRERF